MAITTQPTQEQIDRCERTLDLSTTPHTVFYQVHSENSDAIYEVRYNKQYHCFTCTCPSGKEGFLNCHVNPTCKHCRWSVAAEAEYQQYKRNERQAAERIEATAQYQQEQREQSLYTAERNLAQERNATVQCSDGSYW